MNEIAGGPRKPIGFKSELEKVISLDFDKGSNDKYDHTYLLPVLSGPHQDRPLVKLLKGVSQYKLII